MAILQVRDVDDRLYASLKALADKEHRSLSQEVIHILEEKLGGANAQAEAQEKALQKLGEIISDKEAEKMIRDIRKSRKAGNSWRFSSHRVIFD